MRPRPPHLLPGQNAALRSQIVLDSPLELWRADIARRGIFTAEKLAALAVVLGIIFSQVSFVVGPADAAPDEITGTVFEDIAGEGLNDGTVGDANNPGLAGVPVSVFRDEAATQTADSPGEVGQYSSIAIGSDGNPVVAYGDMSNGDVKVLHCDDAACSTFTTTTVESAGSVGQSVSLAIGADGFPVISHYDWGKLDLRVYKCSNVACTAGSGTAVDTVGSQGSGSSLAIGTDGLPIISYFDGTAYDLKVAHCNDAACGSATITAIDTASTTGAWSSIAIGSDGLAVVSYRYVPSGDLKVAHCDNVACTSGTSTTVDTAGDLAGSSSIAQGSDGFPAVAYFDLTNRDLKFAHCTNLTCTTRNITTVDGPDDVGYNPSVAIGSDGNPIIAHYDFTNTALKLTYCDDLDCSSSSSSNPDSAGNVGSDPSLVLTASGSPIVAYQDQGNYDLKILTAANGAPDAGDTFLSTTTTDVNGAYSFSGLSAGDYLVAVESTAVSATAGYDTAQTDTWAEQTYGPAGSLCANGSGGTLTRSTAGACYGGSEAGTSDAFDSASPDVTAAEHVAGITAGAAAANFGFSFNAVTNTLAGDTRDDDATEARTVQGSLRQFIQNANAITGANAMRFVPAEPTNATDGSNSWWRIAVTNGFEEVIGDGTVVDGTAYAFTDGTAQRNTNTAQIGAGVAVGTDGTYTTPKLDPELEIWNDRGTAVLPTGLVIVASDSVLRDVSIWGFGDSAGTFDTNVKFGTNFGVDPDFTGSLVEFNVIGTGPASFTDPGAGSRSGQKNLTIRENDNAIVRDNLIGFAGGVGVDFNSASNAGTVLRNEIRHNGILNTIGNPVGVWISGNVTGNLITDNGSGIYSGPTLSITYEDNTITANGWGGARPHGIQVSGSPTTIRRNVIADNAGAGVVVNSTTANTYITRNSIHGNGTANSQIGIDLLASGDDSLAAPYVTLNDAGDSDTGGNGLLNYPVLDTARIEGTDLVVTGWSAPGTTIELYLADPDPTGFGEGKTWLVSLVEGSASDTDGTTSTYGPGLVNGLDQGTDTTDRFSFTIPLSSLAALVAGGDSLTSLATSGTNTSEFGGNVTVPVPFTVNSTDDDSDNNPGDGVCNTGGLNAQLETECTLRAAIEEANASATVDTIHFDIPTSDGGYSATPVKWTIFPNPALPTTTQPVTLDATTQPGHAGMPVIVLDGSTMLSGENLLTIEGGESIVRGFAFHNHGDDAIEVEFGDNVTIQGNFVGLGVDGVTAVGTGWGFNIKTNGNTIGGPNPGEGNVLAALSDVALESYNGASNNTYQGNKIGTDFSGTVALPIGSYGLDWYGGVANNLFGGTGSGEGNIVANAGLDGIKLTDSGSTGNAFIGNAIYDNGGLGIDLVDDGVTANDAGDGDGGPNGLLNFPVITSATEVGGTVSVGFELDVAAGDYRIEFFTNAAADPSGHGEGGTFVDSYDVVGHPGGSASYSTSLSGSTGDILTATATEDSGASFGSTSEFSATFTVTSGAFVVNSTGDQSDIIPGDGKCYAGVLNSQSLEACTFRAAIEEANALPGADTIAFNIPDGETGYQNLGGGLSYWRILLATGLPTISDDLTTIDATTQTAYAIGQGYNLNASGPEVVLDGADVTADGVSIDSSNNTVRGLTIQGFNKVSQSGVYITTGSGNTIVGNYIGTDAYGTVADANTYGVRVWWAPDTVIGGTDPADRNVISGNDDHGIIISGTTSTNTSVIGNYIGTNAIGDAVLANGGSGVFVSNGSNGNTIGGTTTAHRNVISGNGASGVTVTGSGTNLNVIVGNFIGVDATGAALGNDTGVEISLGADSNTVGGTTAGERNIISGNTSNGVYVANNGTDFNQISGNYIGTDLTGTSAVPNSIGVFISAADDNIVGGAAAGAGNLISGNTSHGVALAGVGTSTNRVLGNYIGTDAAGNADLGNGVNGVYISAEASSNEIGGLLASERNIISGNDSMGVYISGVGSDANTILGNFIGTNAAGTAALGNSSGVYIASGAVSNQVGGASIGARNVISGNGSNGVWIVGAGSNSNTVQGNYIGTDAGGTVDVGNTGEGILIAGGASTNTVNSGNVISGNTQNGISITDATSTGNVVAGNLIGTDATGTVAMGNSQNGIRIAGAGTTVGGTVAVDRNIISANTGQGLALVGTSGNTIQGNYIGTDITGSIDLGNGFSGLWIGSNSSGNTFGGSGPGEGNVLSGNSQGIWLLTSANNNVIQGNYIGTDPTGTNSVANNMGVFIASGANGNLIGGTAAGEANVIAFNTQEGIALNSDAGSGNAFIRNQIHSNTGVGIDFNRDGVTANDVGDVDTGSNDLLNFPEVTSATETAGTVTVDFDLDVPDGNYRVEFFDNTAADPSGNGEGETFSDSVDVAVTGGVPTPASHTFAGSVGDIITATATEGTAAPFGSTSEFSAAVTVTAGNIPPAFDQNLLDRSDAEATAISLSAAATDPDAGDTLTYSATSLPLGLSINTSTGLITGIINHAAAASSPYSTEITVCDDGTPIECDTDTLTWTITNVPTTDPYLVAGSGGVGGGDDLLSTVDETSFDPATNEVDIGIGTGTSGIEAAAVEPLTGDLYAIDGGQLGVLNTDSGVFTPVGAGLGSGDGEFGAVTFDNVNGMTFHPLTGHIWAVHTRPGLVDALLVIDPATGAHIPDQFGAGVDYIKLRQHSGATDYTALAIDPTDWQLYGVVTDGAGTDFLVRVRRRNGNARIAGSLAQPLTDLSFDATGQLWGIDSGTLYQVNKRTAVLDSGRTIDNGSNYGALAFAVPPALPPSFEGTVFEDIVGDALAASQFPSDVNNPGVSGVTVNLYRDDGTTAGEPDAADTLFDTKITGPTGKYFFEGVPDGTYYVAIDSTTVAPTAGGSGWAEQTYGPVGAATFSGGYSYAGAAGPLYGGKQATVSDVATDASNSEHVARLDLSGGAYVEDVDFGFSFSVVTNVEGGDATSPQGSLRRFIGNANTVTGPNAMRFVPAVATNATDGGGSDWWTIPVTVALSALADAATTIDGTAYDSSDGTTVLDTNSLGPELELDGTGSAATVDGLLLTGGSATVRDIAVNRFGRSGILITSNSNTVAATHIGTGATGVGSLGNSSEGIALDSGAANNLIGGTGASDANLIAYNGSDGVDLKAAAGSGNAIIGNTMLGNTGMGIDLAPNGANVNDGGDGDSGSNDLLNHAVITSAVVSAGTVTVAGTFDVPAGDYRFEFFTNTVADPTGYGEGETLVGSAVIAHTGSGYEPFGSAFPGSAGDILTVTVTEDLGGSYGSTSEFSAVYTVTSVDTTPPVITLLGANPQVIEVGTAYSELGATALDDVDGDISGSIVINSAAVNTAVIGSYSVTYDVSDAAGNPAVQVVRTVDVVDTTIPVITLLGADPQVIEVGAAYSELGATASDNYDGDISGSIVINSLAVNAAVVGSYSVTYDVSDANGNAAVQVSRTVDVVDTTLPVIALLGANPQVIEVGTAYSELGATASDNYDGDISGSILIDAGSVNTAVVGSYSVTYDVSDANGNAAVQVSRTVDVVDTTLPVIALLGANPQVIEVGTAYSELGATASDNYDGDISGSILIDAGSVNTAAVGSYSVTYDVTDANGNAAVQVVRTVDVVDTTAPVITLLGSNPLVIEAGAGYSELGATASDNYDGDISGSIVINSLAVNTAVVGSYSVTYDVTDANGNAAVQVIRTVDVVDATVPVITLLGANPQTIEVGTGYSELGATASDNYDGDISSSIVINSSAVNTAVVGSYVVTYDVVDSSGNPANGFRTVDVVDTTAPVITLLGSNPQTIEVGTAYSELGATASDNYDGDISGSIAINSSAVNTAVVGSYSVTYDVTDSEGNLAAQVVRTVDVVDSVAPIITLLGANPQAIEVGTAYTELGATAFDVGDGDITGSIVINSSAVNAAVVGSYSVTYDVTDSESNSAIQAVRTVDVVDTTVPVIALLGANPQTIEVGTAYSELGATASDNYDGDISGSIVVNSAGVNTTVVGSYSVAYDVADSAGNAAVQVTRTVDVVDTTVPVIALLGANPQTIEVGTAYSELGATASDNYDGDISGSIVVNSAGVNATVVGSYSVTYDVTDANGNAAVQVTRTVDVVDTTVPVITLVGSSPQVIEVGTGYSELGATASDNYDGDISGSIVVNSSAVNPTVVGSYSVTYDVTDANGNTAVQVVRTVDVVDTTAPVITLVGSSPQVIEVGTGYSELGATASDNYDGDISGSIVVNSSAVNPTVVGSYSVTYDVTDANGNAAVQVTRTVDVVDTTVPVITLVGSSPQVIEVGTGYSELGATASDNYDGDISGSIVVNSSAVNPTVVGSYSVTYDVTDANGNAAVQVTRTVDVVDTTVPVIALLGANPQTIEVGTGYSELGATASDNYDGDISGSIVVNSAGVNATVVGSYSVTYDVTDANGNAAVQVTRTVDVVDTTVPVITLVGSSPQVIEVGTGYSELGATASDNYDGDISGSIVVNSSAVNPTVVGSYSVTYDVTDANGNAAVQVTRTVDVVDTTVPVITLVGSSPQVIEVGTGYSELGATASDNYDGDISGSIVVNSSAVNPTVVGSYSVTYDVTDANGNAAVQVTRTVDVVDTTVPVIALLGANPQTIEVGTGYSELGATASDNYDGDISGSIVINPSAVNTAVVGSYPVTYDVTDANGNPAVQVVRTVDVVDTTVPVITLLGANPQTIEVGAAYTELGATAADIGDGDISGSIVIDAGSVNTGVVSSYTVTYDVTDSQGNAAVQVTRTVDVVDTTVPVITLLGANPQIIEAGTAYNELGATASDNYDGDISGSIVINTSAVNTAVVGSYPVTYNVTDSEGNAAIQVTRTVDVVDTTVPLISLLGPDPQVIEVGSVYTELGATASDNYDGDISGAIVIDSSAVNTAVAGSYPVTYDVTDSEGNAAIQVTRTVDVVDTTVPVITLLGANPQVIEVGTAYTELGATASDNYDGDISGSIVVNASAVNTALVGTYVVTYDVTDSSGNPASAFRTVDVVDTTPPVITLLGDNPQVIEAGTAYTELGATALDNYDGDISGAIVVNSSAVNTALVGSYPVTYDVTDSEGNVATQATRTVDVVDTTLPVITLLGANPQSIPVTSPYGELGATASDNYDGDISGSIVIDASAVNTAVVGSYPVTYDVTDSEGNAAAQVIRTVNVTNVAPTLGAVADQTVAEGTAATFTATASDPDPTDTLAFSLSGAPAGASIDPISGAFTWTPSEAQGPNVFVFDVMVTDGGAPALTDSQTVTFTVTEVNVAPSIGAIGPQSVDEQALLTFTVVATDPDLPANTLIYSLAGSPPTAGIDAAGVFTWTPAETDGPGVYTFDVIVTDGGLGAIETVTVTVGEVNAPPTVTNPGAQASAEADVVSLSISAGDPDVPANTLAYSAAGLPTGLTINPASGEISGTIDYASSSASPFTATVTVTDNGVPVRSTQTVFTWTVTDTNRSPVAVDDSMIVAEDSSQSFDVLGNDFDPDADSVTVTNVGAAANGSVVIGGAGVTYTPDPNYFGPDSFNYTISDGRGGFDSATVTVSVTPVNDAPSLVVPASLNVAEHEEAAFVPSATDIESDTVTFSLAGAPLGATINPVSGAFSWTPTEADGPGTHLFDIVATDDGSPAMATSAQVRIVVTEANSAPTITNPGPQVSAENTSVALMIVATDGDIPANSVSFTATGLPTGLSIDPATGVIGGTLPFDAAAGSPYNVTITVTDDGAPPQSSQATFTWTVLNMNRPPTAMDIVVFAEAGVPAPLVLNGTDPDGDLLSFSLVTAPVQGTLTGGPRMYDYTAAATGTGSDQFTFSVSDGEFQATGTVTISITPNLPPSGGSDEYTVRRGGVLVVDAPGVLADDADPEGEPITSSLETHPAYGTVVVEPDGSFVYSHNGGGGDFDLFTYVIDDGMRFSLPITVLVAVEENDPPVATNDSVTLDEDTAMLFHPMANDHDPNNEAIVIASVEEPLNGTVEWSLDGAFVYRPHRDWNGTDTLTYRVTDGEFTAVGVVTLIVRPVNDAPVASDAEVTGDSGNSVIIDLRPHVSDVDDDQLRFILEAPPVGSVTEVEPGVFQIDLDGVIKDLAPLTFIVSDPDDAKATSLLNVTVKIPAELVGVPSLVGDDLRPGTALREDGTTPDPPGTPPLVTGLRLMVGSVLDTFQALRIPLGFLLLFILVSLYLGLSRRFAFASTATVLPLGGRKRLDIVMAQSRAGVPARMEPGIHQPVVHRFEPDESGIVSTGARMMIRSEVWIEVETPEGDAWVNAEFVTEQQSSSIFADDLRPRDLIVTFVEELYHEGDMLDSTGGHDLHVALYSPPVRFAAGSLRRLLSGASVYWWWGPDGDTPKHQGTFAETVGESIGVAYRNRDSHLVETSLPIPVEFVNMHSLVVGNEELGEGWRIFFRYEDDEPSIAGLMREVAPNPASMHGLVRSSGV